MMAFLGVVANYFGVAEPGLRLVVSLFLGYPLAALYRSRIRQFPSDFHHLFFFATGLLIGFLNYGSDIIHSLVSTGAVYLILKFLGPCRESLIAVFVLTMSYLLVGYYITGTDSYDIKWTMAQCVLTLRLIGLSFDVYDGTKPEDALHPEQKKIRLQQLPPFHQVAAHAFFPGSFLVGPQFPFKRYIAFVEGEFDKQTRNNLPRCQDVGHRRLGLGCIYLCVYLAGSYFCPDNLLLSQTYMDYSFWKKCVIVGFWGKVVLYKYIACWLISEGVCTSFGLTFNGHTPEGQLKWDGCENVKLTVFEGATRFEDFIQSFNINTNVWVGMYIFRRLKFLGNRDLSYAITLFFLAVWHGIHSGYYSCFFMEFIIMNFERGVLSLLRQHKAIQDFVTSPAVYPVIWVILKLYTFVFMGYSLVPFALLSFTRWNQVYFSLYYCGHILFLSWAFLFPYANKLFPRLA